MTPEASTLTEANLARWLQTAISLVEQAERFEPTFVNRPTPHELGMESASSAKPPTVLPKVLTVVGCLAIVPLILLAAFLAGYRLLGPRVTIAPIVFAFFLMPYSMYLLLRNRMRSMRFKAGPHWSQSTG